MNGNVLKWWPVFLAIAAAAAAFGTVQAQVSNQAETLTQARMERDQIRARLRLEEGHTAGFTEILANIRSTVDRIERDGEKFDKKLDRVIEALNGRE